MSETIDLIRSSITQDTLAYEISNRWDRWNAERKKWLDEAGEVRKFVFATSTRDTTVGINTPWKNSTTLPKLCQIRDNLHANYMSALFSHPNWIRWEATDKESADKGKASVIERYIKAKAEEYGITDTISELLFDYIDYGNCFALVDYKVMKHPEEKGGPEEVTYTGPVVHRISPADIVFNPTARDWRSTPKIIRSLKSLGELRKDMEEYPDRPHLAEAFNCAMANRGTINEMAHSREDVIKALGYQVDGFGNWVEYLESGMVEILELYGDIYDPQTNTLYPNHIVTIIDRVKVVRQEPLDTITGEAPIIHARWRYRTDNLWGMGPLDNLIGLQYRLDHLENIRADGFDFIAYPPIKVRGDVDEFTWEPGTNIYVGDDGDIEAIKLDAIILRADTQMAEIEARMEEYAGSPKETAGFRTPGEKTAFEVEKLITNASKMFQDKITQFEKMALEPIMHHMLEVGRRHLTKPVQVSALNSLGAQEFESITPADVKAKGRLRPMGARHFSAKSTLIQNLTTLTQTPIWETLMPDVSRAKLREMVEWALNIEPNTLFRENAGVFESRETAKLVQQADQAVGEETGLLPGDSPLPPEAAAQ